MPMLPYEKAPRNIHTVFQGYINGEHMTLTDLFGLSFLLSGDISSSAMPNLRFEMAQWNRSYKNAVNALRLVYNEQERGCICCLHGQPHRICVLPEKQGTRTRTKTFYYMRPDTHFEVYGNSTLLKKRNKKRRTEKEKKQCLHPPSISRHLDARFMECPSAESLKKINFYNMNVMI